MLTYLGNKTENLQTLQRIALDATDRKSDRHAGLTEFWNNETKGRYLDRLKSEGYSVDNVKSKGSSEANGSSDSTPPLRIVPTGRKVKQKNLISRADHNPFINHVSCERAEAIWRELQFELEFDVHDNAIAVLVRVLLELAVTEYARSQGIAFERNDPLVRKVSSVADSMMNRGFFDSKARSLIKKFESDKPLISAHSMHQYVHNAQFHPAKSDLKSLWNVIRPLVVYSTK